MGPHGPRVPDQPVNDQAVAPGITIERLTPDRADAWDAFVQAAPGATFFHCTGWKTAIEQTFGHDCPYLMACDGNRIVGVLPLSRIRSMLFGDALSSTAFCVYGGPVGETPEVVRALTDAGAALADELGVDHLELRSIEPCRPDWPSKSESHATFRKDLAADPDAILKAIPRKQRAVVRKALEGTLRIELDQTTGRFFPLYAASVRNLGTPVFARRWFAALKRIFGDDCEIAIVLDGDRPVAGLMSFYFRNEALPYYAGGVPDARRLGAHELMYYNLMCRAASRGCTRFDFGRSKTGSGPYAFKKNFGFEPQPLHYEYYLRGANTVPDVSPNNPKYRWMTAIWKRLPLPVTNALGPMISRYLG